MWKGVLKMIHHMRHEFRSSPKPPTQTTQWQQRLAAEPPKQQTVQTHVINYHDRSGSNSGMRYEQDSSIPKSYTLLQSATDTSPKPVGVTETHTVTGTGPGGQKTVPTTTTYQHHEELIEKTSKRNSKEYKGFSGPSDYVKPPTTSTSVSKWMKEANVTPTEEVHPVRLGYDATDSSFPAERSTFSTENVSWDPRDSRNMSTTVASYDVEKSGPIKTEYGDRNRSYNERVNLWEREGPIRTLSPAGNKSLDETEREVLEMDAPFDKRLSEQKLVSSSNQYKEQKLHLNGSYNKEALESKHSSESRESRSSQSSTEKEVAAAQRERAELSSSPPPPPPLPPTSVVRMQQVSSGSLTAVASVQPKETTETYSLGDARIEGPGIGVIRLKRATYFDIRPAIADKNDLKVTILPPSKQELLNRIHETRHGFVVEYTPREVGTHRVHIKVKDEPLPKSPYTFKVYDPEKILVSDIKNGYVGKPVQFSVDANCAGYGNLEIAIKDEKENIVPSNVNLHKDTSAKFNVSFVPERVGQYMVHISFNGEVVGRSPFACSVLGSESQLVEKSLTKTSELPQSQRAVASMSLDDIPKTANVDQIASFEVFAEGEANVTANVRELFSLCVPSHARIEGPGIGVIRLKRATYFDIRPAIADKNDLKVTILPPSKQELLNRIQETRHGFVVEYTPREVGTHRVHIKVKDEPLPKSPYTFKVYDPEKILVSDIKNGCVGKPVQFSVDANCAGYGNLEIAIKDEKENIVPSNVNPHKDTSAKFNVSFVPERVGQYMVHISFNGEVVGRSPFACSVLGSESQLVEKSLTKTSELPQSQRAVASMSLDDIPKTANVDQIASFEVFAEGEANVTANVRGPKDQRVPTKVLDTWGNAYRVEFVPTTLGDHEVSVRFADVEVQGSPFMCRVCDARRIRVGNIPTEPVGTPVHFVVDASEAGVGNLEVAVNEGRIPSMAHSLGNHRYDISFVPRERVDHTVSIRFNNEPVPGSPFTCKIQSIAQVSVSGTGLERIPVKRPASFNVEIQGAPSNDQPVVNIKDSSGQELPVSISTGGQQGHFKIEYTPQIVGNHTINVNYGGSLVTGSPFTAKAFDAGRVKLHPVEGNMVGKPNSFYIDAAKAGAGNMEIIVSVENRNVPNFVQAEGNAKFKVSFTPLEAKKHTISVKFNGDPVPGSPMETLVMDGSQCVAIGDGLKVAGVNKTASFVRFFLKKTCRFFSKSN